MMGIVGAGCSRQAPPDVAAGKEIRGELIQAPIEPTDAASSSIPASGDTNKTSNPPGPATIASVATVPRHAAATNYFLVGFEVLAGYNYEMPDDLTATNQIDQSAEKIPKEIRSFNQQPVALRGYMLPLKAEAGLVTELLIMRDQSMCCFGTVPKINEWVSVKMAKEGVKAVMDQPVTLLGKLRVGEMRENGYLVGIYALDGDRLVR